MKKIWAGALVILALGIATTTWADTDVGQYYWILKQADFDQLSTAAPTPGGAAYQFTSVIEKATKGSFNNATVTPPGSGSLDTAQTYSLDALGDLIYNAYLGSELDINDAFGSGGYTIDIQGKDQQDAATLVLAGDHYPAEVPQLSNSGYINGQLVFKPTVDNTLTWNSFADGVDNLDLIILTISESSNTILRVILPSTDTQYTIPANFLTAEQSYVAELTFVKLSGNRDTADISGATGFCGYSNSTRIYLSTSSLTPVSGLANISTRGQVGTGQGALIAGFIITSTDSSTLRAVLRGIGPTLNKTADIKDPLLDPNLTLYNNSGQVLASNDNWATDPGAAEIKADGLAPDDARESALLAELPAGNYTSVVRGDNDTSGLALAELYNLSSSGNAKVVNISTRGQVGTDDDILIGGLIIGGPAYHDILVRALGPSLASQGVTGVLANPVLQLFDEQGTILYSNDDWKNTQEAEIQGTGIPPTNDLESAIFYSLGPGNYTATVKGKSNGTGVGLVEIYQLN